MLIGHDGSVVIYRRAWIFGIVALALVVAPGCGLRQRFFGKPTPTRSGRLIVTPPTGAAGTKFTLEAVGFLPGEAMTFEIDVPAQRPFVGPPHTVGPDGTVKSLYQSQQADPSGTYQVKAVGARGTRAQTTLVVSAAASH